MVLGLIRVMWISWMNVRSAMERELWRTKRMNRWDCVVCRGSGVIGDLMCYFCKGKGGTTPWLHYTERGLVGVLLVGAIWSASLGNFQHAQFLLMLALFVDFEDWAGRK